MLLDRRTLRKVRLFTGITLREMAQATGLDESTICSYETGRLMPSRESAARWHATLVDLAKRRIADATNALSELSPAA